MTPNSPDIAIKVHNDTFRHIMAEERKRNNKPTPSPTRPHPCPAGLNKIVHLNKWLLSCARNTTTFPSPSLSPRPSVSCHSSNWPLCTTRLSLSRCPPSPRSHWHPLTPFTNHSSHLPRPIAYSLLQPKAYAQRHSPGMRHPGTYPRPPSPAPSTSSLPRATHGFRPQPMPDNKITLESF